MHQLVARQAADDGKEQRRAAGPVGGIPVPNEVAPIPVGQALHLRAERRDLQPQMIRFQLHQPVDHTNPRLDNVPDQG